MLQLPCFYHSISIRQRYPKGRGILLHGGLKNRMISGLWQGLVSCSASAILGLVFILYLGCATPYNLKPTPLDSRPYRLAARTRPSQGCNRGSIPRRVTGMDSQQKTAREGGFLLSESASDPTATCWRMLRGESKGAAMLLFERRERQKQ